MIPSIVVAALVLVVVVAWALIRRRAPSPGRGGDSDLRDAFVGILMTVGPFFGVRYQPPRVEIPVVTTPASDDLDPATAARHPGDDGGAAAAEQDPGEPS